MIVACTLASAARSCIQRCREFHGRNLLCSCSTYAHPGKVMQQRVRPNLGP